MAFHDLPIQKKLLRASLLISGVVLLVTSITFFTYEYFKAKEELVEKVNTLGRIISSNSTAAIAFDNPKDAGEILSALKLEPHIEMACVYKKDGTLFARYPDSLKKSIFPPAPEMETHAFDGSSFRQFQRVMLDGKQLGTLYIQSDLSAIYSRFRLYLLISFLVIITSFLLAYFLSGRLQKSISIPILTLSETARTISVQKDYTVRAPRFNNDEIGILIDTFNDMLDKIQEQNQALSEFNTTLELKVLTRTSELETANKELESFSYSVSHDLRAPIRAINGFAAILVKSHAAELDKEGRDFLNTIIREAGRMGQLIDDLLAFARLGKKEVQKTRVDMTTLARETMEEELKHTPTLNTVNFILHPMPPALCDGTLVRQVYINLLANSIKFSNTRSEPRIEIGYRNDGNRIVYFVKDNGVGFDMKYYNKLFGVFQRLHSYEEFSGTGIGLAIVHRIITRHGGSVWAEGKVNEGATFFFTLSPQPQ
jgi:signal transduction histidine kinase